MNRQAALALALSIGGGGGWIFAEAGVLVVTLAPVAFKLMRQR